MKNLFNLDKWNGDAEYLVLDDIKMKFCPNIKGLLGSGGELEAYDRYRAKRTIFWAGKPTIVLCNDGKGYDWEWQPEWDEDRDWFNANCTIVRITDPMY